jgi:hypothetical protein
MAATPTRAGHTLAVKQKLPGYPRKSRDEAGRWSLEYMYNVTVADAYTQAPAHNSAPPSPENTDFPTLICTGVEISPGNDPLNAVMRVTYTTPGTSGPLPVGTTLRSSTTAMVERAIDEITSLTASQVENLKAKGRRTVPYFTVSYRRRSIDAAFTWNQASIISGVGARSAPTGMTSPTANKWLKTERNLNELESAGDVEVEDVWMYDENGWDTTVYP